MAFRCTFSAPTKTTGVEKKTSAKAPTRATHLCALEASAAGVHHELRVVAGEHHQTHNPLGVAEVHALSVV